MMVEAESERFEDALLLSLKMDERGNKPRDVTKIYISGESKSISILSEYQSQHLLMRLDFPKDLHFLWLFIPRSPLFYN